MGSDKDKVQEHLGKIVDRVIAEKPHDAYGLIEVISRLVKESQTRPPKASTEDGPSSAEDLIPDPKYIESWRKLDQVPVDEEGTAKPACMLPDFMEEAELLSWAGIGFSELECYKIACSLRGLATTEGLTKVRLWGKVLGTNADYYVAETQADPPPDADEEADMDASGEGVNQYTYFAATDLCGDWQRLPDIKPPEIVAARSVRKLVTGDPSAMVITHPFFPGKEAVLLRAQIARVTADTVLCAKGFLKRDEDTMEVAEDEEFVCPPSSEFGSLSSWMHSQQHILRSGRTKHLVPAEDVDEEDKEAVEEQRRRLAEQEADPGRDHIETIDRDGLDWAIRRCGDTALYRNPADASGRPLCHAVTVVRSLTWPGAVSCTRSGRFVNFYVGYGLPAGEADFFFRAPPRVQDEPEDILEEDEPQGTLEEAQPDE
mmetsp:Transcript_61655/g.133519  ORF Transcript_61655/g.133519 Transcript_61655/m.133519 type:complete len:430 (-) Transcript_61655:177-1466(-)